MKNMIKILVLAVAMITFNVSTYAQKSERQRMTREQLAEAQAHFIADEMAMDDTTAKPPSFQTEPNSVANNVNNTPMYF